MRGEFQYNLDAKGRLSIPAKLRDELGDVVFVCKGLDNCLFVYPEKQWLQMEEKLQAMPISKSRRLQRTIFPSVDRFELDAQGRILIAPKLRAYANLSKETIIIGAGNRAEIWNADAWTQFEAEELNAAQMADAMDELGF